MTEIYEIAKRDANKMKELSEFAKVFITELNGKPTQFQVEEVIYRDGKWDVTVSYYRKVSEPNELQRTLGILGRRVYKRITIDWSKKQILGMSEWHPERREAA